MYYSRPKRKIRYDRIAIVLGLLILIPVIVVFGSNWLNKLSEKNYIDSITVRQDNQYPQYENDFKLEKNEGYFLQLNRPKSSNDQFNSYYDSFISDVKQVASTMSLDPTTNIRNYRVITINYEIIPQGNNYDFVVLTANSKDQKLKAKSQLFDKTNNKFIEGKDLFFDNLADISGEFAKVATDQNKALLEEYKDKISDSVKNVAYDDQKVYFYLNSDKTNYYDKIELNRSVVEDSLKFKLNNNVLVEKEPPKPKPVAKQVNEKIIAISLDDGPGKYEDDFISLFNQLGIKATFFYIGENVDDNPAVVKRVYEAGHEIGNHTYTHPDLRKISSEKVTEEISKTNNAIKTATGHDPVFLRPPYGAINDDVKKQINMPIIYWNVDSEDWKLRPNTDAIVDKVLKEAHDGSILLFHSLYKSSYDAIARIVPELQKQGYRFVTVTELHRLCGQYLQPHVIYYGYDF